MSEESIFDYIKTMQLQGRIEKYPAEKIIIELRKLALERETLLGALSELLDGENWHKDRHDEMYWCGTTNTYDKAREIVRGNNE